MASRALLSGLLASCAACSILYDPDNLPAQTDAADIDAPTDADPAQLAVTSVEPATVLEGLGSGAGRPAMFVLRGSSIVGSAQVALELVDPDPDVPSIGDLAQVGFDATGDGTQGGLALRLPVMPDLAAGETTTLRITITQGDASAMQEVTVQGLDELRLDAGPREAAAAPATYSRIEIAGAVHFTGTDPVRLFATGDIVVSARIDANALGRTAGPHGCDGGGEEGPGSCTPGGGGGGGNAAALGLNAGGGGGGGGFGGLGTGGAGGAAAGTPGMITGSESLVPIVGGGNRGNGGGGGGKGLLGAAGGLGGGGGGVIYLAAGGTITVAAGGALESRGATSSGGSGGGGGGSGGAILVRAGGGIVADAAWLSAPGGGASTGAANNGGPGGVGRIRIDTASGDVAAMATEPAAFRGPAWAAGTPTIATASPIAATLHGQPGRPFGVRLNDADVREVTPGAGGTVEVSGLALRPGRNEVCAVALAGSLTPESLSCVEVFFAGR